MNKLVVSGVAAGLLVAAGGAWFVFARPGDPVQTARALIQKGDTRTALITLRNAVRDNPGNAEAHALLARTQLGQGDALAAERDVVQRALARSDGRLATAARLLGVSRPTLYTLLETHGLSASAGDPETESLPADATAVTQGIG